MRVLFIYPTTGIEGKYIVQGRKEPLGLCYISAYLRQYGHETKVLDQLDKSEDEVLREVRTFQPDAVGFSTMAYNYAKGLWLATKIKQEYKEIPIMFGGSHATGMPDIVKEPAIDFAVIGEGEKTVLELLNYIQEQNHNFQTINGISFYKDGQVVVTQPRERITNLDELPFPDRSLLPINQYQGHELKYLLNRRIATMHTARGCIGNCIFCPTPVQWPGGWHARSAKNVVAEMEYLVNEYGIESIFIADEDFMNDKNRVYAICDEILRRKISVIWICFCKIVNVEENILKRMREAGCINLLIGIESMHDNSLKKIAKKITIENTAAAIKTVHKTGLIIGGSYMLGYPWETLADTVAGLKMFRKLKIDHIYLNYMTPFPGTPIYNYYKNNDWLVTEDFSRYDCRAPVHKTLLPQCDYNKIRMKWEKNINFNFHYLIKILRNKNINYFLKRFIKKLPIHDFKSSKKGELPK
jgi:anaerobic magnesium-protoporphyrin IX monomethyl ester cyclase